MATSRPRSRADPLLPLLLLILLAPLIYSGTTSLAAPSSSRVPAHIARFVALVTIQSCVRPCSFQDAVELGAGAGPQPAPSCRYEAPRCPRVRSGRRPGPPRSHPVPRFSPLASV
jgi:hypothetical protein